MIVDSSALVAIVLDEPSSAVCLEALVELPMSRLSAANLLEAATVVDRVPNPRAAEAFDELLEHFGIIIEPVTAAQVVIAWDAYSRFGRGSGHPATLNFGDCFAYALAKDFNEPLLFDGSDFVHSDVPQVLA